MQSYLRITAPFDGIVTERLVHPGALVGPGADPVLLQYGHRGLESCIGLDGGDMVALEGQYRFDIHGSSP